MPAAYNENLDSDASADDICYTEPEVRHRQLRGGSASELPFSQKPVLCLPSDSSDNYNHLPFRSPADYPGRKLVGVDGLWYDVTHFKHPGGPIIEKFIGEDATDVFHAYGHDDVLSRRRPLARYVQRERHPADKEFVALIKDVRARGWFKTSWLFYAHKITFCFSLYLLAWLLVLYTEGRWRYLGAVALAFHWQQSGFIMHEFMHTQVFKNRKIDEIFGMLFGTTQFGISAHWWKDEHVIHHAVTNMVNLKDGFYDPQMHEKLWAQHPKVFPLFRQRIHEFFIKIQHYTFVPVVVFIGRYDIVFDSMVLQMESRLREWLFWIPHWIWVCAMLSFIPSWSERCLFYFIAASIQGIFHFQLILSHYCREHLHQDEFHKESWFKYQTLSNMNIDCPRYLDWYYGGLNFHIEHHIMPRLPRCRLRQVSTEIKAICERHDIEYCMVSFTRALILTLSHLKRCSTLFSIDPR